MRMQVLHTEHKTKAAEESFPERGKVNGEVMKFLRCIA